MNVRGKEIHTTLFFFLFAISLDQKNFQVSDLVLDVPFPTGSIGRLVMILLGKMVFLNRVHKKN
jgi:hypothetical protein